MFTQGDRCTLLAGTSGKHVEKFGHFKEFLAGNRNALRALAELEMLYYGGQSFTTADVAFHYEQLFGQVRALVNALNNLSEQRYAQLNQQADAVNALIRKIFRPSVIRHDLPPVVALADMGTVDILGPRRGALVPEDQPVPFARSLVRLLLDAELRQRLAQEGRDYAAEWSDERLAVRMADLYRHVVAKHSQADDFNFGLLPL